MMDPMEALRQIRERVDAAFESDDIASVRQDLEAVRGIIDRAMATDGFQTSVGEPRSGR